jgi:hypothetical protein
MRFSCLVCSAQPPPKPALKINQNAAGRTKPLRFAKLALIVLSSMLAGAVTTSLAFEHYRRAAQPSKQS